MMTPEEKLARVEKLLNARDAITEELLELMGDGEQVDPPSPGFTDAVLFPTRQKKTAAVKEKKNPAPRGSRYGRKECCGSTGTRHFKTCPEFGQAKGNPCRECKQVAKHAEWCSRYEKVERAAKLKKEIDGHYGRKDALPKTTFDRVKTAAGLDIPPDVIASNLNLTSKQVNEVILTSTYEDYAG